MQLGTLEYPRNSVIRSWPTALGFHWRSSTGGSEATGPRTFDDSACRVERQCGETNAKWLVSTGIAPLTAESLESIGRRGTVRMNFLTDDPWNPGHRSDWFMRALPHYDVVYTPRASNVSDLKRAGCADVRYLPFAYAPDLHFPELPASAEEDGRYAADVMFAGGRGSGKSPIPRRPRSKRVGSCLVWRLLEPPPRNTPICARLRRSRGTEGRRSPARASLSVWFVEPIAMDMPCAPSSWLQWARALWRRIRRNTARFWGPDGANAGLLQLRD